MTRRPLPKAFYLLRTYETALRDLQTVTFNDEDYVRFERRYIQARSAILRALLDKELKKK